MVTRDTRGQYFGLAVMTVGGVWEWGPWALLVVGAILIIIPEIEAVRNDPAAAAARRYDFLCNRYHR